MNRLRAGGGTGGGDAGLFATATGYFDYVNNIATGPGITDLASSHAITRASTGYAQDNAGNWPSFGNNVLRRTNLGLLVEESRTNSIRNNSMQGAVAGTPGTLPTFWTVTTPTGLTRQIVGTGTAGGVDYVDIRYSGTIGATGQQVYVQFEGLTQIAAAVSQVWTASTFIQVLVDDANLPALRLEISERDGGGANLSVGASADFTSRTTWQRPTFTRTLASASTAFLISRVVSGTFTNGAAVDFTIRIGWPQLELGSFATSPIRTTNAAATRAADIVTVEGTPFNSIFGSLSQYTLYMEHTNRLLSAEAGANASLLWTSDGTNNNRAGFFRPSATNTIGSRITSATVAANPGDIASAISAPGTTVKTAIAVQPGANGAIVCSGGVLSTAASPAVMPSSLSRLSIGTNTVATGEFGNIIVRRVVVFSTRFSDAQLQALTT